MTPRICVLALAFPTSRSGFDFFVPLLELRASSFFVIVCVLLPTPNPALILRADEETYAVLKVCWLGWGQGDGSRNIVGIEGTRSIIADD